MLVLLLAACGSDPDPTTPTDSGTAPMLPPDGPGAYGVGTEASSVPGDPALPLQVWFPTHDHDLPAASYDGAASGDAQLGATPACDAPHPFVVFSHGNGGLRYQSWFLTEHLASHGYVVAAPDHVGNTTLDLGTVPLPEMALRRPADVSRVADEVFARAADPSDPLYGCVDEAAGFAMVGHSFGGWTTLAVAGGRIDLAGLSALCATGPFDFLCGLPEAWAAAHPGDDSGDLSDPRAWAAVPLTPVGARSLGDGLADITVPTLVIGGTADTVTPWAIEVEPIYRQLEADPRALAGLVDAGHYDFTDFCFEGLFPGCEDAPMTTPETHAWTEALVLSWLRSAAGTPDGWAPDDPAVTWEAP